MRTRDAAKLVGVSWDAAKKMLCGMSRVIPIAQDDRGFWMAVEALIE